MSATNESSVLWKSIVRGLEEMPAPSMPFGGSMECAAATVRSKVLVVTARSDEVVNPAPALEFARLTDGHVVELDGRHGHQASSCDQRTLWAAVARFLDQS